MSVTRVGGDGGARPRVLLLCEGGKSRWEQFLDAYERARARRDRRAIP
ncbi:hypothetical protein [Streptomyces tritici]